MSCYNSTVPSSPPQNVTVKSVNSASLRVSWQPPPMIEIGISFKKIYWWNNIGTSKLVDS